MRIGQLLGTGRSADVYAIDEAWVLRRYRDSSDATPELAVMSYLSACGYRPRVGPSPATATPSDLVLQRLTGPTMLESLLSGALVEDEGGAMLAASSPTCTRSRPGSPRTRRTGSSTSTCTRTM